MEALSELGPEAGAALLADRSAEEIVKLTQELPSDDAAAIIDYLPEGAVGRGPRADCRSGRPAATSASCSNTPSRPPAAS